MTWETLRLMFLARDHGRGLPGQEYVWTEFGDYVGPIILALAILGILLRGRRTAWMLIPLVGWSRVWLRAHTVLQVVAGIALGAISVLVRSIMSTTARW